jgi:hypothetical protein
LAWWVNLATGVTGGAAENKVLSNVQNLIVVVFLGHSRAALT